MAKNLVADGPGGEKRYFVAVVPPEPLRSEITALKHHFREHYGSSKALNSPPHVTLHMPFKWKEAKEKKIEEVLQSFCKDMSPFELALEGFGAFEPRVIFVQPAPSEELRELQKNLVRAMRLGLNLYNAEYKDKGFHPHITLAFRDLKKSRFAEAWEEFRYRHFSAVFSVNSICLLKHTGVIWEMYREIRLNKAS